MKSAAAQASQFLTARWIHLAMLNYEVDPATLVKRAPAGTELDSWNGQCLVSVVGFQFLDTRLLGLSIPLHRNFDEVNLRFYVRRMTSDGPRRGVVFVKEIVPRRAIAWLARWLYNENYIALPMTHMDDLESQRHSKVEYQWRYADRWNRLAVTTEGELFLPPEDSETTFITEHYWGYGRQRDGSALEYQVEHPRWRVWRAAAAEFDCEVSRFYGAEFAEFLQGPPRSAFVAEGSAVIVHRGVSIG